jgi:hypothetical protein
MFLDFKTLCVHGCSITSFSPFAEYCSQPLSDRNFIIISQKYVLMFGWDHASCGVVCVITHPGPNVVGQSAMRLVDPIQGYFNTRSDVRYSMRVTVCLQFLLTDGNS